MALFENIDYKRYLRHYLDNLPRKGRGELGKIARHLRVSPTLMTQILSGPKHLSLEHAQDLTRYFGMNSLESEYFLLLVHKERAGTTALEKFYADKLQEIKQKALKISHRVEPSRKLTEQERAVFYSSHLYAAVWLFTSLDDGGKNLDEIMKRFEIPRLRALEIIKFLADTGLCSESDGRYKMGEQSTHVEQGSPHLLHHYRNWRIKAIQKSESLNEKELMYTAAISLSRSEFEKLREEMVEFIKNFLKRTHASPAEELACFNLDFFWIEK